MTVVIRKNNDLIETSEVFKNRYLGYANSFSEGDLLRMLSFLNKTQYELKSSSNQKLKIEIALCHLIGFDKSSTLTELLSRIDSNDPVEKSKTVFDTSPGYGSSKQINSGISNVRPVLKDEVKIPEITAFIPPSLSTGSDLKEMAHKWQNFVEQVRNDKMFFGSVLVNANLVSYTDNQVHLEVEHPDDEGVIEDNKTYLDKKTKEIFGEKIEVKVSKRKKSSSKNKPADNSTKSKNEQVDENALAEAIINELGGKEIKR